MERNIINSQVAYYTFLETVDRNKEYFHQNEIKRAEKQE